MKHHASCITGRLQRRCSQSIYKACFQSEFPQAGLTSNPSLPFSPQGLVPSSRIVIFTLHCPSLSPCSPNLSSSSLLSSPLLMQHPPCVRRGSLHGLYPGSPFFPLAQGPASVRIDGHIRLRDPAGSPPANSHESELKFPPSDIATNLQKVHNRAGASKPPRPLPKPPKPEPPQPVHPNPTGPIRLPHARPRFQPSRNVGPVLRSQRSIASNSILQ